MKHNRSGFSTFEERKNQENFVFSEIIKFFEKSNFNVIDVGDDKEYFLEDIDLIIDKEKEKYSIEVKVDNRIDKTDNFFLEIVSNEEKTTTGAFLQSQADIFFYYAAESKTGYLCSLKKLQSRFFHIRSDFKNIKDVDEWFQLKSTHTKDKYGNYLYTTIGRLIKKEILLKGLKKYNIKYLIKDIGKNEIKLYELKKMINE